jgi:hypothetical protein
MNRNLAYIISTFLFFNCSVLENNLMNNNLPFIENFDDEKHFQNNWINNSWKSPPSYQLKNGELKITTRPNSKDRVKIRSKRKFTTGVYNWRIFVPIFKLHEQVSIGAFLYHNEEKEFEFDFEIGSGQKLDREKLDLKDNEAMVYCVSQFFPSNSSYLKVKMNAYSDFRMQLVDVDGFYLVKWFINNSLVKTLQTKVKSTIEFKVHCSLENLHFMGDTKTTLENEVFFDSFNYNKNE